MAGRLRVAAFVALLLMPTMALAAQPEHRPSPPPIAEPAPTCSPADTVHAKHRSTKAAEAETVSAFHDFLRHLAGTAGASGAKSAPAACATAGGAKHATGIAYAGSGFNLPSRPIGHHG